MNATFHSGELAVQERVGKSSGAVVRTSIPEIAADFLVTRPALVIAGRDDDERMWATMVTGQPGFMQAPDARLMVVHAVLPSGDPLAHLVAHGGDVGAILWDHHGRMRVNGILEPRADGFAIHTVQVYSNCGRYIAERHPVAGGDPENVAVEPSLPEFGTQLSVEQIDTIRAADTFFVGTSHPSGPADASHRGGNPGFIVVESPRTLHWPDYNGNGMFMTLGNIVLNPRVGLLFPDWAAGGLLQVSGRAELDWSPEAAARFAGAERVIDFTVDAVEQRRHALPTRWSRAQLSRYNPKSLVSAG